MRFSVLAALLLATCALSAFAQAPGSDVGLGVSLGAAFPLSAGVGSGGDPSFNWGFYVNIPLMYSFHLAPSAEVYQYGGQNVTDFDIAFKFIVPLSDFSIYAGFSPGLTTEPSALEMHVGLVGGGSLRMVSNVDAFVQIRYTWVFLPVGSTEVLHANAGVILNL